jgi:hypothetical protein
MAGAKPNSFDQFDAPADLAPATMAKPNSFDQFDAPADAATAPADAATAPAAQSKPLSRIIGADLEGYPVFEDQADNDAVLHARVAASKFLPLGVIRGLRDIPDAGAQLLTRGLEAIAPAGSDLEKWAKGQRENVEAINRGAEADYQKNYRPEGTENIPDVGRIGGNMIGAGPVAAAVPGVAAASLPIRMLAGAVGGGAAGALTPTEVPPEGDFWQEKEKQAALGAAGGTIVPVITGGIARMIAPRTAPAVTTLMNSGVTPTPGQILGGVSNRIEEAAQSIPFVGDAIKAARARAVEDLNRAAINRALAPIGESLNPDTPLGRQAISEMHDKITANYDQLVPQLNVRVDQPFVQGLSGPVTQARARLSDPAQQQFDRILKNDIFNKFDPQGGMAGEDFKVADSELKRQIRSYSNSSVASDRDVGRALSEVHSQMSDLLKRSNPARAPELDAADEAYANAVRVEGAAAKPGGDQGVFTPAQLLQSIRQTDPTLRKGAFARGEALMQDLGDTAKSVLGNKVPDSGTPLRAMVAGPTGLAGLAGLYAVNPMAAGGAAAGAGGLMSAYSRPGVNTLATLLARRPAGAPAVAAMMRNPALGTLPAIIAQDRSRAAQ